ncbi:MAG: hypothetical protein AAF847_02970 [Bacteroidota bacterium]
MIFSEEQIKDITEDIHIGMKCFIRKSDQKIIKTTDWDDPYFDQSAWEKEDIQQMEDIQNNLLAYHEILKMPSHEAFEVMENFADAVEDHRLKNSLMAALNKRKPFAHFKNVVDYSDYRSAWFEFRDQAQRDWVRKQIRGFSE